MKKIISLLFILLTIGMASSCGDDKDNHDESLIVGTWVYTEVLESVIDHTTITFSSDKSYTLKSSYKYPNGNTYYGDAFGTYEYFREQSILILKSYQEYGEASSESIPCIIIGDKMIWNNGTQTFTRQK